MRISLRKLAVFEAVAKHDSVSRAAEELALSQSAASMALKELEEVLGIELFQRAGGKLILNENGRRLQPLARSLLAQAREIERIAPDEELAGVLRIMSADSADSAALGAICAAFVRAYPSVRVSLKITSWGEVLDSVENMKCDVGFVEAPCNRPGLTFEPVASDDLVIFASPDHPLANHAVVTADDLANEPWCMREVGNSGRHLLAMMLGAEVPSLLIAVEANNNDVVKSAVSSGLGIGCLPRSAVRQELAAGTLVVLPFADLKLARVIGMISPKRVFRGALADAFRACARQMSTCPAELRGGVDE